MDYGLCCGLIGKQLGEGLTEHTRSARQLPEGKWKRKQEEDGGRPTVDEPRQRRRVVIGQTVNDTGSQAERIYHPEILSSR